MRVLNLVIAAIEQADFPNDDLEREVGKYLEKLEAELESVGFTPSKELGDVADDLEEALTDYYAEGEDKEEEDLEKDEDTLPIEKDED